MQKQAVSSFNVRVYGVILDNQKVLLSFEQYKEHSLVKFPGGGIEFGEGTLSALIREIKEELGVVITSAQLLHVHEQFIQSAFEPTEQIICIYYRVTLPVTEFYNTEHRIKWVDISQPISPQDLPTFDQDKQVLFLLADQLV